MDETVLRQFFEQLCKRCVFNDFVDKEYAWSQFLKCKPLLDKAIEDAKDSGFEQGLIQAELQWTK